MKKTSLTIFVILVTGILFSFKTMSDNTMEVKITVQSSSPVEFDMLKDNKTIKGLKTPYELVLKESESKMIFKSRLNSVLKIKVEGKNNSISSDWPITVVLIENDKLTSFGIF